MAVPTTNPLSIESVNLMAFDDHLSRWCSSSSFSSSSTSTSRSSSSTGFPDCPSMSKSFTDSMSSDTQTENETPPESPNEACSHLQTTPVFRDPSKHRALVAVAPHHCRPDQPAYLSIYSESGDDYDGSDAGYETECEGRRSILLCTKRPVKRRKALDRSTFRRLGEPSFRRPAPQSDAHTIPSAPLLGSLPRIAGQSAPPTAPPTASPTARRGSISRPGGPNAIAIPETSPPVFPSSGTKASIGLGLGLGLPSTLSAVQRSPNCAYRSSNDSIPSTMRSLVPVTHADLLHSVNLNPLPPTPLKPRLNPLSPPSSMGDLSPLDLASSSSLDSVLDTLESDATTTDSGPTTRPRHAGFCFSHGAGMHTEFCTSPYGTTAAAFLTMANHAQTQQIRLPQHGRRRRRIPKEPPSRGSLLPPTQEEVCPGDDARGIRRFAAMNPYFASMGYCVTSG